MDKIKKIINIILNITIVFFALLLFFSMFLDFQTSFLKKSYKSFFGFSAFEIKTASMKGSIDIGDLVIVKNTKNVSLNDIVTYEIQGQFITHRVIQQLDTTYVTRGDANNTDDNPITSDQIVGKVIFVLPKVGIIKSVVFKPGFLIPMIVALFVICLIIDDKEDGKNSYLGIFKNRFNSNKKKDNSLEKKNINNNVKSNSDSDVDLSKTAVLSTVNVKGNKKLLDAINKKNNTDEYCEEPVIFRNL